MLTAMSKANNAKFCARVTKEATGLYRLDCFLRVFGTKGLPMSESVTHTPNILHSEEQAKSIATELARAKGYDRSEIVWE
jgi:hypothetical protein